MATLAQQPKEPSSVLTRRTTQPNSNKPQDTRMLVQRAQVAPGTLRTADILQLQRTIGNRATRRLLFAAPAIQAKMEVGPVDDAHEQEADRVAREVVRRTSSPQAVEANEAAGLQRQPLAAQIEGVQRAEEDELEMKRATVQRAEEDELEMKRATVQRAEEDELEMKRATVQRAEEDELEMKREADPSYREGGALDGSIEQSIRRAKGGGESLEPGVQRQMESGFGATFGGVRIHRDAMADKLTNSVQAKAFTTGKDIFFKRGEYNPGSSAGKELLAHELTHTVQQGAAGMQRESSGETIQRKLTKRAKRAFEKAKEVKPEWSAFEGYTDTYMPTKEQDEVSKLRSLGKRAKKSPEAEKRLKDYIRAYLLSSYAGRLHTLYNDPEYVKAYATKKEQSKRQAFYFDRAKLERDKYASLVEKGPEASETQAFLTEYGFQDKVAQDPVKRQQVLFKGPRIDVRSTFIGGPILGVNVRAHLFIIFTGRDGKQIFFRGGPNGDKPTPLTVAHYGPYAANTVDYDPSAPSVTLLEGEAAESKLDALIEATSIIDSMKVPYRARIGKGLSKGENCNATAWTILTRAGIKPGKPTGVHPGWGSILGSQTLGKENALPERETFDVESATDYELDPDTNATNEEDKVIIYLDRDLSQMAAQVDAKSKVGLLSETDQWRRIVYDGKIGYVRKVKPKPKPLVFDFVPPPKQYEEIKDEEPEYEGELPNAKDILTLFKPLDVMMSGSRKRTVPAGEKIMVTEVVGPNEIHIDTHTKIGIRGVTTAAKLKEATTEGGKEIELVEEKKQEPREVKESELGVFDRAMLGMFLSFVTTNGTISAETLRNWGFSAKDKEKFHMFFPKVTEAGWLALEAKLNVTRHAFVNAVNEL